MKNESLLGTSVEHILKNNTSLKVSGLTFIDRGTPDEKIPKLRLVVISATDNSFQIYDKDEVLLTCTTDLITIICRESNLTLQEVQKGA